MPRAIRRIVVPGLLAVLLSQVACSVPQRPGATVEGGADGFVGAELSLLSQRDACAAWQVAMVGGAEGGIAPSFPEAAGFAAGSEGGEDGFHAQGLPAGLQPSSWCFAEGGSPDGRSLDGRSLGGPGWIAGGGTVISWQPFAGHGEGEGEGASAAGAYGRTPPLSLFWPGWAGAGNGATRQEIADTGLGGGLAVRLRADEVGPPSVVAEPPTLALLGVAMVVFGLFYPWSGRAPLGKA